MRLATTEHLILSQGLHAAGRHAEAADPQGPRLQGLGALLARGIRPAVGFTIPDDVLKDPHLTPSQKREILTSWASDASAVQDEPTLRWLLGTPEPVAYAVVRDALLRLERLQH